MANGSLHGVTPHGLLDSPLGSAQDGGNDGLIARAAAQIPRQRLPHLRLRRLRRFAQKGQGAHEHTRRTEATLQAVFEAEGLLQGVQLLAGGEPFHGADLRPIGLYGEQQTTPHGFAV